jgi:hypothetical protein
MDDNGAHHVARIDDTVTSTNLHQRAEAVAVPDFDYLEQTIMAMAWGLGHGAERARQSEPPTDNRR